MRINKATDNELVDWALSIGVLYDGGNDWYELDLKLAQESLLNIEKEAEYDTIPA